MIRIIFTISLLFISTPSFAEEMWVCEGFIYQAGSKGDPFILRGTKSRHIYENFGIKREIKYVQKSQAYDIYVEDDTNIYKSAVYVKIKGDKLGMKVFNWDEKVFKTVCTKQ